MHALVAAVFLGFSTGAASASLIEAVAPRPTCPGSDHTLPRDLPAVPLTQPRMALRALRSGGMYARADGDEANRRNRATSLNQQSIAYWRERGMSEAEAKQQAARITQRNQAEAANKTPQGQARSRSLNPQNIAYWRERGMSEAQAQQKAAQATRNNQLKAAKRSTQ